MRNDTRTSRLYTANENSRYRRAEVTPLIPPQHGSTYVQVGPIKSETGGQRERATFHTLTPMHTRTKRQHILANLTAIFNHLSKIYHHHHHRHHLSRRTALILHVFPHRIKGRITLPSWTDLIWPGRFCWEVYLSANGTYFETRKRTKLCSERARWRGYESANRHCESATLECCHHGLLRKLHYADVGFIWVNPAVALNAVARSQWRTMKLRISIQPLPMVASHIMRI